MPLSVLHHWVCACRHRRRIPFLFGLVLLPLLGGCIVGVEKPDAALDVPNKFTASVGNADAALPKPDWWRGFRSQQLTDLIEESLTSNFDIAAAIARITQADAQARIAGAPLLPTATLNPTVTRSRASQGTSSIPLTTSPSSERTIYTASGSASYTIDFWGQNRAALVAAQSAASASRFDREVVALTTVVAVATAYFEVVAAEDRLRVARENLAAALRVLKVIQDRLAVGTASALDIAQQQSVVDTQRAAIPPLVQTLRQNEATLALLIGHPPERVLVRTASMRTIAIPAVTPGMPSDLLTQRPDIREAEAQLASANANVESARAAFFPSISLTGQGGYQSAAFLALMRPETAFFSLTAGLTQPLLDGGLLQGQYDLTRGKQDEALQNYRKAVINGFTDVEKALIAVQQTAERERLQREVVRSSRRAFEIAEQRLREGTVDLVTLLQTQQTLFQALDTLVQARLDRLLAVISLYQALGGGWHPAVEEQLNNR
ncbi:MAG TPA: efflux transporter outer membrane subunit [Xanthobacteraceae bacterium]|nr:efflux transporter outer membrane subunit [Xanthobacteraceae bacterium]